MGRTLMATDPAHSTTPPAARHLWQVPAFLLGAAAFAAVIALRPHIKADTVAAAEHQLRDARKYLEQTPIDLASALERADTVLAHADRFPHLAGQAHFLAGSAHLRLADEPNADAAHERQQAREQFEKARAADVPESDKPKLDYRLAKVMLLIGGDASQAISLLEKAADADDAVEGYGLLAQAYARLSPPDLDRALKAAKQHLDRALRTNDARLQASARYRVGELDLKLKNEKDGRAMLMRVGQEAPPEQFYAARVLLAESFEQSQEWTRASSNWDQARQNPKLAGAEKAKICYHLARCRQLNQEPNAGIVYDEAVNLGGDEGQAASLRLAEMKLDTDPAAAIAALATALQSIHGLEDYRNPLVSADEVRPLVEKAIQVAKDKSDWDLARKAVEVYGKVAAAGKDDELSAQLFDAQGHALAEKAKTEPPEQAAATTEQAKDLYRQAAAAYERAAGKVPPSKEHVAWLWQSAQYSLKAGQMQRAQDTLLRVTQFDTILGPDSQAEAWLLMATNHRQAQQYEKARMAYQKCLAIPGPFVLKARLGLAMTDLAEGRMDDAENGLQAVLKALHEASQPDVVVQEETVYALGRVAYARQSTIKEELREYATAEQRLLGALQQYPNSSFAPDAAARLGLVYWTEARAKERGLKAAGLSADERRTYEQKRIETMMKSAEQFEKAEEQLLARQRASAELSPEDGRLLRRVSFWSADCYFWLPRYEEAARRYGALALRYQGLPEELIALTQLYSSYLGINQVDKALSVKKRLQEAFDRVPDAAFDGTLETHKRDYWVKILAELNKPAIPQASSGAPAP
jgi:hypothetical protein